MLVREDVRPQDHKGARIGLNLKGLRIIRVVGLQLEGSTAGAEKDDDHHLERTLVINLEHIF